MYYHTTENRETSSKENVVLNKDDLKFIKETVERDLDIVNTQHDSLVDNIARLGQSLSDLRVLQSKLMSIANAIKDDKEEEKPYSRCC